jgi:hypothetical protein
VACPRFLRRKIPHRNVCSTAAIRDVRGDAFLALSLFGRRAALRSLSLAADLPKRAPPSRPLASSALLRAASRPSGDFVSL